MAITINCHKLHGSFTRIIRVESNDADNPRQLLTCKGKILKAFKVKTKRISFGKISQLTPETSKTFLVERGDGGPLSPKLITPELRNISAVLKEITPGERYEITVTLRPPYSSVVVRSELKFETGVAESPMGTISIYANITPRVVARPRRLSVPAEPTPGWEGGISLVWDTKESHRITGATVDDPRMQVRVDETAGRQRVVLRVLDGYQPKPGTRAVTIETDDVQSPPIKVPVVIRPARWSVARKATKPGSHVSHQPPGSKKRSGKAESTVMPKSDGAKP